MKKIKQLQGVLSRRRFLGAAAVSPVAAKMAADNAISRQVGSTSAYAGAKKVASRVFPGGSAFDDIQWRKIDPPLWQAAKLWLSRGEIESMLWEEERIKGPYAFDVDLAVNRSMSYAAKVAYQRQRNVAEAMKAADGKIPMWMRVKAKILGIDVFGTKEKKDV